jgi:hypothetical protein
VKRYQPKKLAPLNDSDIAKWNSCKMNNAARDIRNAHPYPNRRARRCEAKLNRSIAARVAAYNNQNLLPPGAVHLYAK